MSRILTESAVWYSLESSKNTVGDLREFVKEMNKLLVPDEYVLDDCIVTFSYNGNFELIADGECAPYVDKYNILVGLDFDKKDKD